MDNGDKRESYAQWLDRPNVEGGSDKNNPRFFNKQTNKWIPFNDGIGKPTITVKHLSTPALQKKYAPGISDEEREDLKQTEISSHMGDIERYISKTYGKKTWEGLSQDEKEMPTDLYLNTGDIYKNFIDAMIRGDKDEMAIEQHRWARTKKGDLLPLQERVKAFGERYDIPWTDPWESRAIIDARKLKKLSNKPIQGNRTYR
jgi:hypothetical protein